MAGDVLNGLQGLHPLGRQKRDVVLVVTLDTIERRDLHGSDAYTGILGEVPLKVLLVDSRA